MASIGDVTRPAFAYDQATDTWVPVGIGPHSHTAAGVGAVATSSFAAKGDLLVGTGAGTLVAQTVGANGTVLTADSAEADGVKWATPAAAGASFTELAATATTTGSTVTVSGLSGYNTLWVTWEAVGTTSTAQPTIQIRFNSDSGSNYSLSGRTLVNTSTTSLMTASSFTGASALTIANQGASAGNNFSGGLIIQGANTTAVKVGQLICGSGGTDASARSGNFRYTGTSVISSVSIITQAGTFDEGTIRVIGSVV